jgi:hypothetical protein
MNTTQFGMAILDWLQSDPSHIVVAASVVAAMTPTPTPGTLYAKLYKILDLFAGNFFHAKETGVTTTAAAEQVLALLSAHVAPIAPAVTPPTPPTPVSPPTTVVNITP